jgi:hypothetical protein
MRCEHLDVCITATRVYRARFRVEYASVMTFMWLRAGSDSALPKKRRVPSIASLP